MKRILAFVLVLCLCGCTAPAAETSTPSTTVAPTISAEEAISGTWLTTVDCTQMCNEYILNLMGQELADYFDFSQVSVDLTLILNPDSTFKLTITQEAVEACANQLDEAMQADLHEYLENLLADKLENRTLDQYLRAANLSMADLLVDAGIDIPLMATSLLDQLRALPCSGTYYISDGLLHIAGTVCSYSATENTLRIHAPEETADLAPFPALFPLEFSR